MFIGKRERVEDLGRILERIDRLLEDYGPLEDEVGSKHKLDDFLRKYSDSRHAEDLFMGLRGLFEKLWEIRYLAQGADE